MNKTAFDLERERQRERYLNSRHHSHCSCFYIKGDLIEAGNDLVDAVLTAYETSGTPRIVEEAISAWWKLRDKVKA